MYNIKDENWFSSLNPNWTKSSNYLYSDRDQLT